MRTASRPGTSAEVVHNGVDVARFAAADPVLARELRQRAGAASRPLILSVGGIEPRKGSDTLMRALAELRGSRPVLAVVGGHSFQDYREYRDRVLASLPGLGLRLDDDVVLLGTVPDAALPGWYAAADVLAFPSTKEGWGLAVLEAMSAGRPAAHGRVRGGRSFHVVRIRGRASEDLRISRVVRGEPASFGRILKNEAERDGILHELARPRPRT